MIEQDPNRSHKSVSRGLRNVVHHVGDQDHIGICIAGATIFRKARARQNELPGFETLLNPLADHGSRIQCRNLEVGAQRQQMIERWPSPPPTSSKCASRGITVANAEASFARSTKIARYHRPA